MSQTLLAEPWLPRTEPLRPCAVAARGVAAKALAGRLLSTDDDGLARLRGVAANGILVLQGEKCHLPWVDGALYLGRDDGAPSLLLPTAESPRVPTALLERAVLASTPCVHPPVAVLLRPMMLVSVCAGLPVQRSLLTQWLAQET